MSLPQFEGNEPDATIISQQKTVCCKIFHKATAVVPVIFDWYETLSLMEEKSLKVFQIGC
jgi:succinate dehydrogenase/fumarate reductase cytochrome b subunit